MNNVWFMHIPKTGGVSFMRWLEGVFGVDYCQRIGVPERETTPSKPHIVSHFAYHQARSLWNDHYKVTFLRNPVDRVVAHYWHVRKDPAFNRAHKQLNQWTIGEWVNHPEHTGTTHNMMVRYLADNQENLDLAIARLRMFDYVGFTECFGEGIRQISLALDLPRTAIPHVNSWTPMAANLTNDERLTILKANSLDLQLYEYAQGVFV